MTSSNPRVQLDVNYLHSYPALRFTRLLTFLVNRIIEKLSIMSDFLNNASIFENSAVVCFSIEVKLSINLLKSDTVETTK